jgi:hypothetical protein
VRLVFSRGALAAIVWVAVLSGCGPGPERAPELVGEFPLAPVQTELDRARASLQAARRRLGSVSSDAADELEAAERSLRRIDAYYLPLLEAESRALMAERFQLSGNRAAIGEELDGIERLLLEVAHAGGASLARETEVPLEAVADARAILDTDPGRAGRALRELVVRLDEMVNRGELVLRGTELGSDL